MKILLPVDGSECSSRAVEALIAHVAWFRERPEIHLLHVHPPIPIGRVQEHVGHDTLQRYYREESENQLLAAQARLDAAGLAYTTHIHVGQPAEVIVHQASVLGCDLIHMGSHGRGMVAATVLGSVAAKVLHLTHCPVLLAR